MRRFFMSIAVLTVVMVGPTLASGPASAHGDEGEMTVVTVEQSAARQVRVVVGILYANDDDLATDATVSVTGTGPDGATLATTPMPKEDDAKYGATIDLPADGEWAFSVTSTEPEASIDTKLTVATQEPTTTGSTTSTTPTTEEAIPSSTTTSTNEAASDSAGEDGGSTGILVAGALVVVVLLVAGGLFLRSRQARSNP